MPGAKEIKGKIMSVKSTQKITGAMQTVAASKMHKAQERMELSRPYTNGMLKIIGHIARAHLEYRHPFTVERPVKNIGYIIVSTDRGLCGGLNINLFRKVIAAMSEDHEKGIESCVALLGSKACNFFSRFDIRTLAHASSMGDDPKIESLIGAVRLMLKAYDNREIDKLCIVYNKFVNTMVQTPIIEQIIPLTPNANSSVRDDYWDYIYEPDANMLLDKIFSRYIESVVYQGVVENLASEQAARMVAMRAATDNAERLVNDLQLVYNKARQAGITQELTEIVSGAAAV